MSWDSIRSLLRLLSVQLSHGCKLNEGKLICVVLSCVLWTKVCNYKSSEWLCALLRLLQLSEREKCALPNALRVTGGEGQPKATSLMSDSAWLSWEALCIWKQEGKSFGEVPAAIPLYILLCGKVWGPATLVLVQGPWWCSLREPKGTSLPSHPLGGSSLGRCTPSLP